MHSHLRLVMLTQCALHALVAGVYADGLPGEYLVTQRWRDVVAPHSPLTNPAFMTEENYLSARGVFAPTLQGAFMLWEAGVTVPIGLYQSAGITWLGQSAGTYQGTQWDESQQQSIDQGTVGTQSHYFLLSYAINPINRLSLGLSCGMAYEMLFEGSRFSMPPGIDVGVSYRLARHPVLGYHVAGLTLQNLVAPVMTSDVSSTSEAYSRNLRLSWLASYWQNQIESSVDVDVKDFLAQAGEFRNGTPSVEYELHARLGGWILRVFKVYAQFGFDESRSPYAGGAAGINLPSVNNGRDMEFLYQYNNLFNGEGVSTHTISARADLGPHREEIYARKMARKLDVSPNELYNKALTLYYAGKYWEAFALFGRIYGQFPDFFKTDWVKFYIHNCQENLDMRGPARAGYTEATDAYPNSSIVPHADLGIMRVAYRDQDDATVEMQFGRLNRPETPESLQYEAVYLLGETMMHKKEFSSAKQFLGLVPPSHPQYLFAQHSSAIALLALGDTTGAVASLGNAIAENPANPAAREIAFRSYLLVGLIFYENGAMSKAVAALRSIPATSFYYEDAQLGLGWSAVRSRQWADCLTAAKTLQKTATQPAVRADALLLEAYALFMTEQFDASRQILEAAQSMLEGALPPSEEELASRRAECLVQRTVYDSIARAAYSLAMANPSAANESALDAVHNRQRETKKRIDDFIAYSDAHARAAFFSRRLDQIKEDVDYTLAIAVRKAATRQTDKGSERDAEKQKVLDEQINQIKKELENIK